MEELEVDEVESSENREVVLCNAEIDMNDISLPHKFPVAARAIRCCQEI